MSKRTQKRKALSIRSGEGATKERRLQNGGIETEVVERDNTGKAYITRQKAKEECVFDAYLNRKLITPVEFEAGMKFRKAYLRAVLRVRVSDNGSGSHGDTEMAALLVIKSEQILREAYSVLTPAQKAMMIKVGGDDDWAGGFYAHETLHRALERLMKLWKMR